MNGNSILLALILAALLLGGVLLSESIGSATSTQARIETCIAAHPDWHRSICEGIAEGRYSEDDVSANPSWDWMTIGEGRIRTGMTQPMVEAAWGTPSYANQEGYLGFDEEWACGGHLLQFNGEVLTEIMDAQLWSAYSVLRTADENAVDFENRTLGEYVFIYGRIDDFGTTYDGSPCIEFEHPDYWDTVCCVFSPSLRSDIGNLHKRQFIVVLGIGAGIDLIGPTFESCRLFVIR